MAEFLLQTDPLEFQNSRQSTKIIFLQQELQQTQEYARDLEQIVKINKEALRIATNSRPGPKLKGSVLSESTTLNSTVDKETFQNLQMLVEQLQEENSKFLEIVEKAKKERNIAQSKALISEQICEEAQRHEAETVHELEEKITDLRKLLQDKEYAIQELEKMKAIPEQEGVVIKYREVLNPSEQNMKFHNEIDALNGMLSKVSKELNKAQSEKQELMTINFSLTNELAKIRATFAGPMNMQQKMGRMNSVGEPNNGHGGFYFAAPMEFLDDNSPLPSPLPSDNYQAYEHHQSKAPVPKLDLSKAKQIQEQYAKKLSQPAQQGYNAYNADAMDKVKQLEEELELTKKRLSHEMINNRLLSEELTKIQKHTRQLITTNDVLIKSNKRYEEKWQKIFYTLEFYKEFYHKYIDLITRGTAGHIKSASMAAPSLATPKFENFQNFRGRMFMDVEADPSKMIKEYKRISEENGMQVNVSILEANEAETSERNQVNKEKKTGMGEFTKEQCKVYLLNVAKDLYVNTNLQKSSVTKGMLQQLKFSTNEPNTRPTFKLKRSLSNPLEYLSERKEYIFESHLKKANASGTAKKSRKDFNHQEGLFENLDQSEIVESANKLETDGANHEVVKAKLDGDNEMISFSVDPEEFNKNKMVEVSFISDNDILDRLKNN